MEKYIVYLTTNTKSIVNGINRIYIGVHKITDKDKVGTYLGCGTWNNKPSTYMFPKTAFQYAVKKYGPDAFIRTTLFEFDNAMDAYLKEFEIVNETFIKQSHVYNEIVGGIGGGLYAHNPHWQAKKLYQFDLQGNLINTWEDTLEACDFFGYSYNKFDWACTDHTEFLDFYWARTPEININTYTKGKKQFTYLYDNNGKLLMEFNSRTECSKFLECVPQSVSNAIRNEKSLKGYFISDSIVDLYKPKPRKQLQNETIYVYTVNNKFLGKFKGKEVFSTINLYSFSKLNEAFNDNAGWYKDFYLSLEEVSEVPNKVHNGKRSIDIYTKEGIFIETLESLKEVKEKYNINSAELNRILKGIKQHKQYNFIYHSK